MSICKEAKVMKTNSYVIIWYLSAINSYLICSQDKIAYESFIYKCRWKTLTHLQMALDHIMVILLKIFRSLLHVLGFVENDFAADRKMCIMNMRANLILHIKNMWRNGALVHCDSMIWNDLYISYSTVSVKRSSTNLTLGDLC